MKSAFLLATCLAGVIGFSGEVIALESIRDQAAFFSKGTIDAAETSLAEINRQGVDVVIETFAEMPGQQAADLKSMDKKSRNRWFDDWAKQQAAKIMPDGIYVLICEEPAHLQIESRHVQKHGFGPSQRDQMAEVMLADLRAHKRDAALADGLAYLKKTLHEAVKPSATPLGETSGPAVHHGQPRDEGFGLGGIVALVIAGVVIWMIIGAVRSLLGRGNAASPYASSPAAYGGGAGFFGNLMTGMFGAMAGNYLYDSFFRGNSGHGGNFDSGSSSDQSSVWGGGGSDSGTDNDWSGSGGDFGGGDSGGGDSGGGGDF